MLDLGQSASVMAAGPLKVSRGPLSRSPGLRKRPVEAAGTLSHKGHEVFARGVTGSGIGLAKCVLGAAGRLSPLTDPSTTSLHGMKALRLTVLNLPACHLY